MRTERRWTIDNVEAPLASSERYASILPRRANSWSCLRAATEGGGTFPDPSGRELQTLLLADDEGQTTLYVGELPLPGDILAAMQPIESRIPHLSDVDRIALSEYVAQFERLKNDLQPSQLYLPLNPLRKQIRVLKVYVLAESGDLHGDFGYAELMSNPKPEYETISYCWGDSTRSGTILLHGEPFKIPQNTELALRQVLDDRVGEYRVVWIDAICIDQDDMAEKASQVALMGTIYSYSKANLIYLGEPVYENTEQDLLDSFNEIAKDIDANVASDGDFTEVVLRRGLWSTWDSKAIHEEALTEFFDLPWFQRSWTEQEGTLSPRSVVFFGRFFCGLERILRAAVWLSSYRVHHISHSLVRARGLNSCLEMWDNRRILAGAGRLRMTSMLLKANQREATNARDKVFALLGMEGQWQVLEDIPALLRPDYAKAVRDVYRDATRYCLEEVNTVTLRHISHRTLEDILGVDSPSWALRFDRAWDETTDPQPLIPDYRPPGDAVTRGTLVFPVSDAGVPDVLILNGQADDMIEYQSAVFNGPVRLEQDSKLSHFFDEILKLAQCDRIGDPSDAADSRVAALARTLIADRNWSGDKSDVSDWKAIGSTLKQLQTDSVKGVYELTASSSPEDVADARFFQAVINALCNRRFAVTKRGRFALVPRLAEPGDFVGLFVSCYFPLLLRARSDTEFALVGACYVDEMVKGGPIEFAKNSEGVVEVEKFHIR